MIDKASLHKRLLNRFTQVEHLLLCLLAVVLPILESPKNLAIFLLLLTWIVHRIAAQDIHLRRPDMVETGLLFMLTSSILSTVLNWPLVNGLKGIQHTVVQVLVFWLIYRGAYTERQRLRFAELVMVGVLIGLIWGVIEFFQKRGTYLSFHSAGGVIESATYLGIALAMTFSIAWACSVETPATRAVRAVVLRWAAVAIMLVGLFFMGNRGAILAVFVAGLIYALAIGRRSFWIAIVVFMALAAVATTVLPNWLNQSRWFEKIQEMTASGQLTLSSSDRQRLDHWRVGVAQVVQGDALVIGIGPHNTVTIDYSKMEFDPPLGLLPGQLLHVHNMFLTKLIEEGIVGLAAMLFFFGAIIARLARDRRMGEWQRWQWFAAVGALTVSVVAGQVGPRWHQEHALLVMMILAIGLASRTTGAAGTLLHSHSR